MPMSRLAALDMDVPIRARLRPCAIDDLHLFKDHFRRADLNVLTHLWSERIDELGEAGVTYRGRTNNQWCQQQVDSN